MILKYFMQATYIKRLI